MCEGDGGKRALERRGSAADVGGAAAPARIRAARDRARKDLRGFSGSTRAGPPLVFTILGEDELAVSLAGVLSSKSVNGRPVFVRFARRPQDAKGSQMLYVAATEVPHMGEVLAAVDATPVLTVSDAPGFATHG